MDSESQLVPQTTIEHVRDLTLRIVGSLAERVDPASISFKAKIPFRTVVLREALMHRVADLSNVGLQLYESQRTVPAFVVTRSLMETVASLYTLHLRVAGVKSASDLPGFDAYLDKAMRGEKLSDSAIVAYNALTYVEKVEAAFPGFMSLYENLCEFAHPNWSGVLASYSKFDPEHLWVDLGKDVHAVPPEIGLSAMAISLAIFEKFYNDMVAFLPSFVKVCEAALEDQTP